ncbi:hypothetical protein [Algoriphagus aquimarinus]|uniref:Exo-alpha-sialidase n=1 Tax=Algoriphagus aquimarinus TaxID=237018 RepID=A0A1I1AQM5_9BACT|nr:hypothetical protein [Algoriphagus aquimarinus]SFB40349.1 hypothetical protein SAMN04489723_10948 [Algoriphagus aquimarinus]
MKQLLYLFPLIFLLSCQQSNEPEAQVEFLTFPGNGISSLSVLTSDGENLLLSYVEQLNDSTYGLFYSQLKNEQFSSPQLITQGTDWFVNWADFPAIAQNKGNLLTHILQKSAPDSYAYDIKLNVLPKGQQSWKTGLPLHQDSTLTEHGFVSTIASSDSTFFLTWLDGRNTGGSGHEHAGAMSIRAAEVDLQGNVRWDELLDARTCDCCQTSVAMTGRGPVVVYRNRSDREIRDIAITRLVEGNWTEPMIIHADGWEIKGCPVNGPKVAARGETVLVSWFTDVNQSAQVKLAFSSDAGGSFDAPQLIGSSGDMGRVDVALLDEENGLVSWMGMENDSTFLFVRRVNKAGDEFPVRRVTTMDLTRNSGFPQMEIHGGKVYFAWTNLEQKESSIGLSSIELTGLLGQ